ncbi:hypothetical protein B0H14DRAFT_3713843, partial [Mycena olivaceomarginata]
SAFRYPLRDSVSSFYQTRSRRHLTFARFSPCGRHVPAMPPPRIPGVRRQEVRHVPRASKCAVVPVAFDAPGPLNWRPRLRFSATNLLRDISSCNSKCSSLAVYHSVNPQRTRTSRVRTRAGARRRARRLCSRAFSRDLATARAVVPFSSSPGPAGLRCDRRNMVFRATSRSPPCPVLARSGGALLRARRPEHAPGGAMRRVHSTRPPVTWTPSTGRALPAQSVADPRRDASQDGRVERGARSVLHSAPWSVRAQGMEIAPPRRLAGPYPHTTEKRWR